ncbi:MAG: hypothetical protein A2857_03205 [Candidatus Levybacteria bacterium RIFCSPHIGHO2_01_FULL_36_15]|nr:MAG: hypothetical protein A2857_03205 [Candidatus Levybacteria bacterium RIFCSPHIGHO2_01_FULL_36_15]OGH38256.1 MAG: hypothetical protein A2905_03435 [Candidatus Levybacteria bacterium RIFCSPLOWO2_01_FULL_36_10]
MEQKKKVFIIIDGNAIIHRAYHALPPLTTKEGVPTGAVYGFFSMLLKIIQDQKPDCLAVTFDRPKPTFRKALFVGYQAHRPKMDDDLSGQIQVVHEILHDASMPIYEVDGFEADDVIGTIAQKVQSSKFKVQSSEIIIVSGDKDMLQLVNSHVKILAPVIGITKMVLYDEEKVKEKLGVEPSQVPDYKAIVGDPSDNYLGINGIGPKTAISLIEKYGGVEQIYQNIGKIEKENPKLALKLAENQETAILGIKLATIVCDVPLSFSFSECSCAKISRKNLKKAFEKYSIKSLIKRADEILPEGLDEEKQLGLL